MKLRHIYINKEGEPMGNPDPDSELLLIWESREEKIKQYHSGLLPFENYYEVHYLLPSNAFEMIGPNLKLKPDTIIPIDLEVEVVEQMNFGDGWVPRDYHDKPAASNVQYRKVLRIKN